MRADGGRKNDQFEPAPAVSRFRKTAAASPRKHYLVTASSQMAVDAGIVDRVSVAGRQSAGIAILTRPGHRSNGERSLLADSRRPGILSYYDGF